MVTSIITVSLPAEQLQFCKNRGLSPSFLLQNAIIENMKYDSGEILDSNASLQAKIERLSSHVQNYVEEINKLKLENEELKKNVQTVAQ